MLLFLCSAAFGVIAVWVTPAGIMPTAKATDFPKPRLPPLGPLMAMGLLGLVVAFVVRPLTNAAVIYAVASSYLEMPISVGIAFRRAWRIYLPMLGTIILAGLLIVLTLFIFLFRYLLVTHVVVIEGVTGTAALKRSRALMKGNGWSAFVLLVLIVVISWCVGYMQALIPQRELAVIVGSALQTAIFIFGTAAWVVFYFSCRCKAENFDLVMLANAVGAEEPPAEGLTLAE